MAKNHMADIARMLGVKLGEEFKVAGRIEPRYVIKADGMFVSNADREYSVSALLKDILTGKAEIIRRPWRPKKGERYWFVDICSDGSCLIDNCSYSGASFDINCILMGNCFPTREAAEATAPDIVRFYQDMRKMVEEE